MDKTTINEYTEQMRDAREQLERRKPDTILGMRLDVSDKLLPEKREYQNLLNKWTLDLREIYNFISDEVNKGGTSFESKTFIQEATKLVDTYNRQYPEIEALLNINKPPLGDRATTSMGMIIEPSIMRSLLAWYYIADFCGEVIRIFTPLIDKCRKDVSAQEPKARPRRPKGEPILKQDIKTLKDSFKDKVWFDTFLKSKLEAKSNKKRLAAIAYIIYEDRYLNKVPGTFTEWHTTFCRLLGCANGQYYPNGIKDFQEYNALSKEFEKSTSDKHK